MKLICGRAGAVALQPSASHVILQKLRALKIPAFHSDKLKSFLMAQSAFSSGLCLLLSLCHALCLEHFLLAHPHRKISFLSCVQQHETEGCADCGSSQELLQPVCLSPNLSSPWQPIHGQKNNTTASVDCK